MGYTTEFEGHFTIDRPVDEDTYKLLRGISETRRMRRDVGPEYEDEGEFYIDGTGSRGQGRDDNIIDYNMPPATQPSLLIQEDRQTIAWDGIENFYEYVEWLEYLINWILYPEGYVVNGEVRWQGEEHDDRGTIIVTDNRVRAVTDTEARWSKASDLNWEIDHLRSRIDELRNLIARNGVREVRKETDGLKLERSELETMTGVLADFEAEHASMLPDGLHDSIREWYMSRYPEDDCGFRIKAQVTFADLSDGIDLGRNLESVLGGIEDCFTGTPVTERCMRRLAEIWEVTYDNLRHKWFKRLSIEDLYANWLKEYPPEGWIEES